METSNIDGLVHQLLQRIQFLRPPSFSGCGLVFYTRLAGLPHIALGDMNTTGLTLQRPNLEALATRISDMADSGHPCHDGFHFISSSTGELTHVSQFIAPPVQTISGRLPHGARQMTALLSSMVDGVDAVGVIGADSKAYLFRRGVGQEILAEHRK